MNLTTDRIQFINESDDIRLQIIEIAHGVLDKLLYEHVMSKADAANLANQIMGLCEQGTKQEELENLRDEIHTKALTLVGLIEEFGEVLNQ